MVTYISNVRKGNGLDTSTETQGNKLDINISDTGAEKRSGALTLEKRARPILAVRPHSASPFKCDFGCKQIWGKIWEKYAPAILAVRLFSNFQI